MKSPLYLRHWPHFEVDDISDTQTYLLRFIHLMYFPAFNVRLTQLSTKTAALSCIFADEVSVFLVHFAIF